jgi:hypothetical protein
VTEQHDDTIVRRRWSVESAAIAGIVYAIASSVALLIVVDYPRPDLPDAELEAWFADAGNRWRLLAALNLGTVAAVAFLWFVGVLRNRIGDREDRFFGTVFYGSAIMHAVFWIIALAALASIPAAIELFDVGVRVDSAAVGAIGGFAGALLFVAGPKIQALFVLSTSTIFLRTSTAPKWLALVGYAFGVVLFVVPVVARPVGLGFPIWVLVASVTVLVTKRVEDHAGSGSAS